MNVIFDVDDTLYNLMDSFRKAHEELYADQTDVPCEELFQISRKYNDEAFRMWCKGLIDKTEEFHYRIQKTYEQVGLDLSQEDTTLFKKRYRYHQGHISLFEGMEDMLDHLKNHGVNLAILTNGNHDDQYKKTMVLEATRWMPEDHIFISEDLPAAKPDVRAFHAVEDALKIKPEDTWYIGDTFESDILGACQAGWHCIWFNHRRRTVPQGMEVKPDYQVTSMAELREVIDKNIL